jgi:hypothetical protein
LYHPVSGPLKICDCCLDKKSWGGEEIFGCDFRLISGRTFLFIGESADDRVEFLLAGESDLEDFRVFFYFLGLPPRLFELLPTRIYACNFDIHKNDPLNHQA